MFLHVCFYTTINIGFKYKILEGFGGGVCFGGVRINNLRYADDTTLICASRKELMMLLQHVKQASEKKGLLLNTKKTKIMVLDKKSTNDEFFLDGWPAD